jgi:hypothetical protein
VTDHPYISWAEVESEFGLSDGKVLILIVVQGKTTTLDIVQRKKWLASE